MAGGTSTWPLVDLTDLLGALDPDEAPDLGPGCFRGRNVTSTLPTVLGSQVLGQTVVVAERTVPGMTVQSLHGVFPRGGLAELPLEIHTEVVQSGRALATVQVSFRQRTNGAGEDGREHYRALVMLSVDEPDFLRHGTTAPPDVPAPQDCAELPCALLPWEVRTPGGADALALPLAGPPNLDVWIRCTKAPDSAQLARALVAYGTEGFLGPVAMRPYPAAEMAARGGRGVSVALAQTVTYHEPFSLHDWVLLRCESVYAGRSRMHGRIQAFTRDGRLVASVGCQGLMRAAS